MTPLAMPRGIDRSHDSSVCRATIYHPHYHPDPSLITADGAAALSAARPRGPRCVWPLRVAAA